MGKTRGANATKNHKAVDTKEVVLHREPPHHDDDEITSSTFPFAELIPNWAIFDVQWKNARTMSRFHNTHHGKVGGKKLLDFKTFHLACCLEFVDVTIADRMFRVRCVNVFTVDSDQCTEHKKVVYKDGPNSIYTLMKRNQPATWGLIKDAALDLNPARGKLGRNVITAVDAAPSEKDAADIARVAALEQKLKNKNPNQRGKTGGLKTGANKAGAYKTGAKARCAGTKGIEV